MMHLMSSLLSNGYTAMGMTAICMTQASYILDTWDVFGLKRSAFNQIHPSYLVYN